MTMCAGRVCADVDRCAAACTVNNANAIGQFADLDRIQLAYEALLDHELAENGKSAMRILAAVVGKFAALGDIQHTHQPFVAAWAIQQVWNLQAQIVAVVVNQFEQIDDSCRRNLLAFKTVQPYSLTGETEVEFDILADLPRQCQRVHFIAAGWTAKGCVIH